MKEFKFKLSERDEHGEYTGTGHKLIVKLFPDAEAMMKAARGMSDSKPKNSFWGYTVTQELITVLPGKDDVSEIRTIIYLCEGHIGVGVLSHEATHAAMGMLAYEELPDSDEPLCYLVGDICNAIANAFYDGGIYP